MSTTVPFVAADDTCKIRPGDIVFKHEPSLMLGRFGKCETEIAAGQLVKFFQFKGSWAPFDIAELVQFYQENGWETKGMFYGLTGVFLDDADWSWKDPPPYLAFSFMGCSVTEEFIQRCLE